MRVGVVGLGFGAAVHVPALRRLEGVEIVGLAGSSSERAEPVARDLGIPRGCGSVEELLELELDALTVAVPPEAQAGIAAAALAADVPVLAEKPLAASVEEADELVALAGALTTAVDFEFAELATFRALRDAVAQGRARALDVAWLTRPRAGAVRSVWKDDPGRGGGVLALLGTHVLHLVELLLGSVEIVEADVTPTRATIACRAGDVPVSIVLDNAAAEHRHEWRFELEDGTLTARNDGLDAAAGFRLLDASGAVLAAEPSDLHPDGRVAPVAAVAARFVAAASTGSRTRPDFEDGLRVQRLLEAVGAAQGAKR